MSRSLLPLLAVHSICCPVLRTARARPWHVKHSGIPFCALAFNLSTAPNDGDISLAGSMGAENPSVDKEDARVRAICNVFDSDSESDDSVGPSTSRPAKKCRRCTQVCSLQPGALVVRQLVLIWCPMLRLSSAQRN